MVAAIHLQSPRSSELSTGSRLMTQVAFLAGARPNYMKVFPVWKAITDLPIQPTLIHSGQHYDELMSDVFFRDFGMEKPTHFLGVGSGPHALQTAKVMIALEDLFTKWRRDLLGG